MRKKYFILAITFLCLFIGQNSYASDWNELDEVVVTGPGSNDSHDPCDPFSIAYSPFDCPRNTDPNPPYDSGDPCDYYSSAYNGCNTDSGNPCDPSSYTYSYSICYGNNNNNNPDPDPVQTQIPDVTVKCISDIKDELRALTQSNFSNILDKFGPNSPYKINISIGSLGESMDLARTQNSAVYRTYDIVFNQNYTKVTSLSIVTSLIHEFIHAYFKTLYDDFTNNNNTHAYDQFPVLKEYYTDTTYVGTIQDAHHEQMANTYIDIIAATIQEFQTGNPVSVGNADQLYKDMAWSSFDGTPVFDNTLVQPDIDRIRSQRAVETYNSARGTSTPKGTSCK